MISLSDLIPVRQVKEKVFYDGDIVVVKVQGRVLLARIEKRIDDCRAMATVAYMYYHERIATRQVQAQWLEPATEAQRRAFLAHEAKAMRQSDKSAVMAYSSIAGR